MQASRDHGMVFEPERQGYHATTIIVWTQVLQGMRDGAQRRRTFVPCDHVRKTFQSLLKNVLSGMGEAVSVSHLGTRDGRWEYGWLCPPLSG